MLTTERRAELEADVFATDRRELYGDAAVRTLAAFGTGLLAPLAGALLLPRAAWAWRRYVRREWRLGALLADERAHRRMVERVPDVDLRAV